MAILPTNSDLMDNFLEIIHTKNVAKILRSVNLKNPLKISAYGGCDTGKPIGELAVLLFLFFFFLISNVCFLFEFFFAFCLFI